MRDRIKVVSFDIGGTLINYKEGVSITTKIAQLMNVDVKFLKPYIQKHFVKKRGDIKEFCKDLGWHQPDLVCEIIQYHQNHCTLYHETYKTVSHLKEKGYILVSISNAPSWNKYNLDSYGIGVFFDLELYSYDHCSVKPDSLMFNHVQNELGMSSDEIIHIGDSINSDIRGAKKVKWKNILIERNSNCAMNYNIDDRPDYIVHSLDDIVNLFVGNKAFI